MTKEERRNILQKGYKIGYSQGIEEGRNMTKKENNMTKECISVNDRLPDKSGFYFGFSDDGRTPCILVYDKEENYIDIVVALMGDARSKVSHWIDAPVKAGEW